MCDIKPKKCRKNADKCKCCKRGVKLCCDSKPTNCCDKKPTKCFNTKPAKCCGQEGSCVGLEDRTFFKNRKGRGCCTRGRIRICYDKKPDYSRGPDEVREYVDKRGKYSELRVKSKRCEPQNCCCEQGGYGGYGQRNTCCPCSLDSCCCEQDYSGCNF